MMFKIQYNPNAPCGVSNLDLQDPLLKTSYAEAPSLPGGCSLLPSFGAAHQKPGEVGGRLSFSTWGNEMDNTNALTIYKAGRFKKYKNYMNLSLASPAGLSTRLAHTYGTTKNYRLHVSTNSTAIVVSCGMCTESNTVEPVSGGGPSSRWRKFISFVLHNQEWERFVAFLCVCFKYQTMHCAMSGPAVQISTDKA
ncbi:hypothetical protein B0H17DRAFT_141760 [Mycena rosella]|uniref:Uncharacterized protein n=1 Tax=Mycena rosella TaxID=1033263 RepID=A0AAD7DZ25_MYCRO|nr:hypothetical protein B0H17DRAFT_141760 [Mycena rosella]